MGFEYRVPISTNQSISLDKLRSALIKSGHYLFVTLSENELSFAYAGGLWSTNWPESGILRLAHAELYILLHNGTKMQRKALIADVSDELNAQGFCVVPEEI